MRSIPGPITASTLSVLLLVVLSGCVAASPPFSAAERDALAEEARGRYEHYMLVYTGASQARVTDADMFLGIATPELAATVAREVQRMVEADVRLEGVPETLSFRLVDAGGAADVAAHVCADPSTVALVDRATGAALPAADPESLREMLVSFQRGEDGRLLVAGRGAFDDPTIDCP